MPPLLAALLMMELGCDLRIVQAIDLGMEWRCDWRGLGWNADKCAAAWYDNRIGDHIPIHIRNAGYVGTYYWPPYDHRRYAHKATK
jgi:hypothetical protein